MEYYSAMGKKEILPFATACVDLEGIMLSELRQRRTNNYIWYHLPEKSKKAEFIKIVEWWLPGAGVWDKKGDKGCKVSIIR